MKGWGGGVFRTPLFCFESAFHAQKSGWRTPTYSMSRANSTTEFPHQCRIDRVYKEFAWLIFRAEYDWRIQEKAHELHVINNQEHFSYRYHLAEDHDKEKYFWILLSIRWGNDEPMKINKWKRDWICSNLSGIALYSIRSVEADAEAWSGQRVTFCGSRSGSTKILLLSLSLVF